MSVKEKKRGRPKSLHRPLSDAIILEQAKVMMREEGKIPSIRQLSTALSVDPMAIYHYFKNKNALLEAVATSLVNDIYQPIESADWQQELVELSTSYVSLLHQYPGLLEILLGMTSLSPANVFIERFQRIMSVFELDVSKMSDGLDLLVDYLHGFALAMNCQDERQLLDVSRLRGPLMLYSQGLLPDVCSCKITDS